jgi:hypothetical protein
MGASNRGDFGSALHVGQNIGRWRGMTPGGPVRPSWPAFTKQQGGNSRRNGPGSGGGTEGDQDTAATIFGFWNLKLVRL